MFTHHQLLHSKSKMELFSLQIPLLDMELVLDIKIKKDLLKSLRIFFLQPLEILQTINSYLMR